MATSEQKKEGMTVQQAGHLGGQRVKELIEQGKRAEQAGQKSMAGQGSQAQGVGQGQRGGSREEHVKAGRQSHKNQ
jgi:hypothetical protein